MDRHTFVELRRLSGKCVREVSLKIYKKDLTLKIRRYQQDYCPPRLEFFHSLFGWLSLLAAFQYWIQYTGPQEAAPKKVLINGTIYNLRDIEVTTRGRKSSLKVLGRSVPRSQVNIAGILYEEDGKLILDCSGDYYNELGLVPEIIVTETTEDQ